MSLIFRIAAGVIIGLMAYQVILMKMYPPNYYQIENKRLAEQGRYKDKISLLKIAISDYYAKNGVLPTYASDIDCDRGQSKKKNHSCVDAQSNGVFYTSYQDNWAAVEPYLSNGRIQFRCKAVIDFIEDDDRFSNCKDIRNQKIPSRAMPSFNCNEAVTLVEKAICNSDRLIDIDLAMSSRYNHLLSISSKQAAISLKSEQLAFIKRRESQCTDEQCIEIMTRKRVIELERF